MILQYNADIAHTRKPIFMVLGQHRIEMYVKTISQEYWHLVLFSGQNDSPLPKKETSKGPFQCADEAVGVRSAIVQCLMGRGYNVEQVSALWEMEAQRVLNENKAIREDNSGDYSFNPKDVFFD